LCGAQIFKKKNVSQLQRMQFEGRAGSIGTEISGGGNTSSPPVNTEVKRASGARRWPWTWLNYPENWVAQMAPTFGGSTTRWIAGYEICPKTKTPHLQGYTDFGKGNKVRPIGYLGCPKEVHWGDEHGKPARGSEAANVKYCLKEGRGYEGNIKVPRQLPVIVMYGWQDKIVELCAKDPVKRKIYWFYSEKRHLGKSDAARWLAMEGALMTCGTARDMKYLISVYHKENGDYPENIVMDIPCSLARQIDWAGMEELINGVFASTKYECKMCVMPYVRFFVFSNIPPTTNKWDMSQDRFEIYPIHLLMKDATLQGQGRDEDGGLAVAQTK